MLTTRRRRRHGRAGMRGAVGAAVVVGVAGAAGLPACGDDSSLEDAASTMQGYVATVWPRTDEIWPGADFSDQVLLLTDGEDTWALTTEDKTPVSDEELESIKDSFPARPGAFGFAPWDGRRAVIVWLEEEREQSGSEEDEQLAILHEDPVLSTFGTATHEAFHHYVQEAEPQWPLPPTQGTRSEPFPLRDAPRVDRTMVFNSLLASYREPDKRTEHLAAAAYWNDKWASEFPDEAAVIPTTDLKEGTAEYFERVAVWMAEADDPTDVAARKQAFLDKLEPLSHRLGLDVESYLVGFLAILHIDEMGLTDAKSTIATTGTPPLSVILAGVQATPQEPAPADVAGNIAEETAALNEPLAETIDPFLQGVNDPARWLLMLPTDKQQGSIDTAGFYSSSQVPHTIMPATSQTFGLTDGTITLTDRTVGLTPDSRYFAVPLDPADDGVALNGDRLDLDGDSIEGSATVEVRTDDGRQTLYPT